MTTLMTAPTVARANDPITSDIAGEKLQRDGKLSQLQTIVLGIFRDEGPMTDTQLDFFYQANREQRGWPYCRFDTPRKRRSELTKARYLVDTGQKARNDFGALEVVWRVA